MQVWGGLRYTERLERLGLLSQEQRLRGDLIEVVKTYETTKGRDKMISHNFFSTVEESKTRGYKFNVRGGDIKRT